VIWLWGLSVGLLLGTILGVVLATRHHRRREPRGLGGSMTDWGQSLALVYELRREIRRLSQPNARLQADRTESLAALARIADSLEREARRRPVQPIPPSTRAPGGRHGPDGSPRP
jgi:predicted component of type VI protein secretion system